MNDLRAKKCLGKMYYRGSTRTLSTGAYINISVAKECYLASPMKKVVHDLVKDSAIWPHQLRLIRDTAWFPWTQQLNKSLVL